MRFRIIAIIFRKEIIETLRDRRTLMMMVGLPLLLYPLMIIGLGKLGESQEEAREARSSRVLMWGPVSPELALALRQIELFSLEQGTGLPAEMSRELAEGRLKPFPALPSPEKSQNKSRKGRPGTSEIEEENPVLNAARVVISNRQADAVLIVWPGFQSAVHEGRLGQITLYYDSVREDSRKARDRLEAALSDYRKTLVAVREREKGLAEGFSIGIEVLQRNVAPQSRRQGLILGSLLPFMIIIISASACLYAAIDLTAGEKERNTLQTLLCAPVHSIEIILGKCLTVWTVALIATLANILSMAATFARMLVEEGQLHIAPSTYVITFLILLPVTFTVSVLFLAVAVFARDFKDGQNFLTPVLLILMVPLGATMIPGIELNVWTAFVPFVNIGLLIKALFLADAHADLIFLTLVSSAGYAMLALLLAARVFEREQVLLGGKESLRTILGFERQKGGLPSPPLVLTAFALMFVLIFYGSLLLKGLTLPTMILVTEAGFFLLPVVLIVFIKGLSWKETLAWRIPSWRGLAAAVLIGLSGWTVVGGLLIRLMPPPESFIKALEKIFLLDEKPVPLWIVWLVLAVAPAVCEELLFRGLIFSGLRGWGGSAAIGVSSLFFGLAHSSIYRLLPTLFLGLLFGYLLWKTGSIFCCMIAHLLNNGIVMTLLHTKPSFQAMQVQSITYLPWSWAFAGLIAVVISLWLLKPLKEGGRASIPL